MELELNYEETNIDSISITIEVEPMQTNRSFQWFHCFQHFSRELLVLLCVIIVIIGTYLIYTTTNRETIREVATTTLTSIATITTTTVAMTVETTTISTTTTIATNLDCVWKPL